MSSLKKDIEKYAQERVDEMSPVSKGTQDAVDVHLTKVKKGNKTGANVRLSV